MNEAAVESLPIQQVVAPDDGEALAEAIRSSFQQATAVYPIGGGTSLDFGLPAKQPGVGLSLANLNRVVDYPARDLTVTVEAGITIAALADLLAEQGQRLPLDVPSPKQATLGGVIATNASGPRRFGRGTIRDYLIGVDAVDGAGRPFRSGGRVVKNVAGYDFCKLLVGSMGTLAVVTQATLKVVPKCEATALLMCNAPDLTVADALLARMVDSQTAPVAIELVAGPDWLGDDSPGFRLIVGLEGTRAEVDWMLDRLAAEWREQGIGAVEAVVDAEADDLWRRLTEFPALPDAPLAIQAAVLPSRTTKFIAEMLRLDRRASIVAHAGSGIVVVRFSEIPAEGVAHAILNRLQPAASGGSVTLLSGGAAAERTSPVVWGARVEGLAWMRNVKNQFDPGGILNPGRFVY